MPLDLPFDEAYWLEVELDGEIMLRIRFASAAYAYRAVEADHATLADSALMAERSILADTATAYAGRIVLHDADAADGFTTTIVSNADVAADYTMTLPADDGTADQVLKTDGSGVLSVSVQMDLDR